MLCWAALAPPTPTGLLPRSDTSPLTALIHSHRPHRRSTDSDSDRRKKISANHRLNWQYPTSNQTHLADRSHTLATSIRPQGQRHRPTLIVGPPLKTSPAAQRRQISRCHKTRSTKGEPQERHRFEVKPTSPVNTITITATYPANTARTKSAVSAVGWPGRGSSYLPPPPQTPA